MANQLELEQKPFIELQIEALIEANRIKHKHVNKFIDKLESRLIGADQKDYAKKLERTLRLPIVGRPNSLGEDYPKHFKFVPPLQLKVIGGYKTSTAVKKSGLVDLAICMPSECLDKNDIKNQKYHSKRALYLAQIAFILSRNEAGNAAESIISRLEFRYHQGDFLKPALLIFPREEKLKETTFQMFVHPPSECALKVSSLLPTHGNVAPKWFFKDFNFPDNLSKDIDNFIDGDSNTCPTPFYNSSILFDLEMISNSEILDQHIGACNSLREALVLLKIWLYQRDLHHHFSFILSMFLAHLHAIQAVHQNMSSYQVFKQIIKSLACSDWSQQGISYYDDSKNKVSGFSSSFPVVFLSPSGHLNLCYNTSLDIYERLKHEIKLTRDQLAKVSNDTFEVLFLKKVEFSTKFDVLVHLPKCTKKLPMDLRHLRGLLDRGVLAPVVFSDNILECIRKGLSDRAMLVQQNLDHLMLNKRWNFRAMPYDPIVKEHTYTFGILLDQEKSLRIMDIGPDAQSKEAEEFRKFWEPKSQLRLQNGIISETVVWHVKRFSQRRAIIKYILTHSLRHAGINNLLVHYTTLDRFIGLKNVKFEWKEDSESVDQAALNDKSGKKRKINDNVQPIGVGEEVFQKTLKGYNEINKVIRSLDNLKYAVTSIQPISSTLRNCSVFPPMPVCLQTSSKSLKRSKGVSTFPEDFSDTGKVLFIEPVDILLSLESSGKWPSDYEALQATKLDYLIQLGESLKAREYCVKFSQNFLDVLHGQFVFRLHLKCQKELSVSGLNHSKQELHLLRLALEDAPRIHAALDQLHRERIAFSLTCRLVKRWICCQLMTDHINEMTIELLVAHLFLHPEPYTEPASAICGFRRFMLLISQHDWRNLPLIINFDNQLKLDETNRVKDNMNTNRASYPPMVVCTPFDKHLSPWTKNEPTSPFLDLLIRVCGQAAEFMRKDILLNQDLTEESLALFRPNFKLFDLMIKLQTKKVQNSFMSVDAPKGFILQGQEPDNSSPSGLQVMPIVGLNIVDQYVKALRLKYDKVALFFHDKYGQRVIGVIMKPESEKILDGDIGKFTAGLKHIGAKLVDSVNIIKRKE